MTESSRNWWQRGQRALTWIPGIRQSLLGAKPPGCTVERRTRHAFSRFQFQRQKLSLHQEVIWLKLSWGPLFFFNGVMHVLSCFSHIWLSASPWTVTHQAPLSMGFSRQGCWSGLPCPPSGDLLDPGVEPVSLMFPALAGRFFTTSSTCD